jgi:hypothetical protein
MESNGSFTSLEIKADLEELVAKHFDGLHSGGGRSSIKGGQTAANEALADIYYIDGNGNQIGASIGYTISSTGITVPYTSFSPQDIESDSIKTVAFEIRDK